jgi:hypothetical protein
MIKEARINKRILKKIDSSDLSESVKKLLKDLFDIEMSLSKGSPYTDLYERAITKIYVESIRGKT